jgi:hypothetical protein
LRGWAVHVPHEMILYLAKKERERENERLKKKMFRNNRAKHRLEVIEKLDRIYRYLDLLRYWKV